jgi:hypothetical protein
MRYFPRPVERAVRFLDKLLADETQPRDIRLRCSELLLSCYGLVSLDPERTPRHNGLKALISARLELSGTDRTIADKLRKERRHEATKLKQELETL